MGFEPEHFGSPFGVPKEERSVPAIREYMPAVRGEERRMPFEGFTRSGERPSQCGKVLFVTLENAIITA